MRTVDKNGFLHVEMCNISKACVNPYYGREIPDSKALGLDPARIYYLYRDPAELAAAAPTFNNIPLLLRHTGISAATPKREAWAGCIGSHACFEAPYLKNALSLWTNEAIDLVLSEDRDELSCSYRYRADMTPGRTPEGIPYDGVMRDIFANHVALVIEGRAGPDVVVADSLPPEFRPMSSRTALLAALAPFLRTGVDMLAVDAAMESAEDELSADEKRAAEDAFRAKDSKRAKDSAMTDEEKAEAYREAKDKKARDRKTAADAKKAADAKRAKDGEPPASPEGGAQKPANDGNSISRADAEKLASDARRQATADATANITALYDAREVVAPLVGKCALDSAEAVYAFALKQAGVATDGVHPSAYRSLVDMVLKNRKPQADDGEPTGLAMDGDKVSLLRKALPSSAHIRVS